MESLKSSHPGLKRRRRQAVGAAPQALVRTRLLEAGRKLPLVVEPALEGLDPMAWAAGARESMERGVLEHGAVLFRGFSINSPEDFYRFVEAISGAPLEYTERSSPRHAVSKNIYTSTDHPEDQSIFPHNEHSYKKVFPLRLFFYCHQPSPEGGATPLVDCREIYRRLPEEIRQRFAQKGYTYVRNFSDECGLPWPQVFQTEDRGEVEAYCRRMEIDFEWTADGRLRTRQRRPTEAKHPRSQEPVWFNHLTFFHVSTLEPQTRDALLAQFAEQDLPNNTYYGDDTPVEPEVLEELRRLYNEGAVSFPWQKGDVLMIDNMLTAHAREPYRGPRKVLVAMADPIAWDNVKLD